LQNLLVKFDEINASIEDLQSLCEHQVLLADSDAIRQQVCVCLCVTGNIVFKSFDLIGSFLALTTGMLFTSYLTYVNLLLTACLIVFVDFQTMLTIFFSFFIV